MLSPHATFEIKRLPLSLLRVTEYQPRSLDRVRHYHALLTQPRYADWAPGFICVAPYEG